MNDYYAVIRSTDHLAHYGVKGMKWGVRKAIARGDQKALDRHFRKAAKKLKKLQDIGLHSGKYAAKSAAYGAAAAGVGTLAVGGTGLLVKGLHKFGKANPGLSDQPATKYFQSASKKVNGKELQNVTKMANEFKSGNLGASVEDWAKKPVVTKVVRKAKEEGGGSELKTVLTNDSLYRIGAGLVTAGLAAKSAQNAYRAKNGAKYRQQASEWKNTMDNEFAGTKYAGKYVVQPKKKRKRRV